MIDTELAWAAGFFDGEGCARLSKNLTRKGIPYYAIQLSVAQKDRRPLDRFLAAVECGVVRGPYKRIGTPMYAWTISDIAGFEKVVSLLWPYLSEPKREQIKSSVDTYYERWSTGRRRIAKTGETLLRLQATTA